ncbi:MAG TPA: glycosyltransferase [Microthrixaceae bacterium]|nr:glycosyltransferase [Microthrixaceae bacterium]
MAGWAMKVLQIHSHYRIAGGEDTVVANEARLLKQAGHQVWQYFEPNPFEPAKALMATLASPWNPLSERQLTRRLRAERPDIAHVHNTWFRLSPSIYRALERAEVPVVRTLHNYRSFCIEGQTYRDGGSCTDCLDGPLPGLRHSCYRSLPLSVVATGAQLSHRLSGADRSVKKFVAPSEFMRDLVVRGGIPAEKTIVKPHFSYDPGERPMPPSASNQVVVLGRLAPGKGVDLLLQAWAQLPKGHGLQLLVAGDGPSGEELRRTAPAGVEFAKLASDEVHTRLLGARALVFPSMLNETFGLVVVEAMAAGLPVVGFDVAGISEILGDLSSDCLVDSGDVSGLGKKLTDLRSGSFVDSNGAANRLRYLDCYTPEAQLPLLEAVFKDVVDARK